MQNSAAVRQAELESSAREEFLQDVMVGLSAGRKFLNPKYFYDEAGSRLFENITELPEYYITRTETQLMRDIAPEIGQNFEGTEAIIEFGSGSGARSDTLLGALSNASHYVPIDLSEDLLASTARVVAQSHPHIRVCSLLADFTAEMIIPATIPARRLGYFPGSTIGNFLPHEAVKFLSRARRLLGKDARMLIGVDLAKSTTRLESAYDDAQGITAEFNKNLLLRINTELDADFDLRYFAHQAFFDREHSRIEMHLVSLADQQVSLGGDYTVDFSAGETIHTENSHKYTIEGFRQLALRAGWQPGVCWTDDEQLFSIHVLDCR